MMPDRALARNFVDILMMMVILCMALSVRSSDEECANVTLRGIICPLTVDTLLLGVPSISCRELKVCNMTKCWWAGEELS